MSEGNTGRMPRRELTTEQVQRWVLSFLVIAVSLFPTGALIGAIATMVDERRDAAIVLLGAMAVIGTACVVVIRLIHRRSPLTWFLVLGVLPAGVTALVVL